MKLWLDDERDPTNPYIQREFGATGDMIWVKSASEAIDLLATGKVVEISLDHDLGTPSSGADVANYIEQAAFEGRIPRLNWRIHTQNPVGRINIAQALNNANNFWGHLQDH